MPNFAGIRFVDADRIVRRRGTIVTSALIVVIGEAAGVYEDSFFGTRAFDGERIGMCVSRLVVRSHRSHVEEYTPHSPVPDHHPAIGEIATALARRGVHG